MIQHGLSSHIAFPVPDRDRKSTEMFVIHTHNLALVLNCNRGEPYQYSGWLAIVRNILVCCMLVAFLSGCKESKVIYEKGELQSMNTVPETAWKELSQKKIFFGHQSVGDNIIDGINIVMQSNSSITLNILKTNDYQSFNRPVFAHSSIGRNDDTDSKINAFNDYIRKGIGNKADIAFFKFCFWDIRNGTDVKTVFDHYKAKLAELKSLYPKTRFIHFTVPLMSYQNGIIDKMKRAFDMTIESDLDNIRRNELNEMIRKEYGGKEPVFDISMVESTLRDGQRTAFIKDGRTYYYLASEYTNDGGHLNDNGKRIVAEQLLIFLARLAEGR
jgi:hypothetical protein